MALLAPRAEEQPAEMIALAVSIPFELARHTLIVRAKARDGITWRCSVWRGDSVLRSAW